MTRRPKYPTTAQLAERRAWAEQFDRCWLCGSRERLETHEIASKALSAGKWADVRNYFRTCFMCHTDVLSWLPEDAQLGVKLLQDPENYDRVFVNRIRSRADEAIEEYEVRNWRRLFQRVR